MRGGVYDRFASLGPDAAAEFLRRLTADPVAARHVAMSAEQKRMWAMERFSGPSGVYNSPLIHRYPAAVDPRALDAAVRALCERHEILRSRFVETDGEPLVLIARDGPALTVTDLRGVDATERRKALDERLAETVGRPFDLATESPVRAELIIVEDSDNVVVLTMHHIVTDGWSTDIIGRELDEFYAAARDGRQADLPSLSLQYVDYAAWQADEIASGRYDDSIAYWRRNLSGAPILDLPLDRARPSVGSFRGAFVGMTLPASTAGALTDIGRRFEATPFIVQSALFSLLLSRYSGQNEVLIGSPESGRSRPEIRNLLGLFVNTIVLRADCGGDPTFATVLDRLRAVSSDARRHAAVPFDHVVAALDVPRSSSRNPLVQALLTYDVFANYPPRLGGMTGSAMDVDMDTSKFDVSLFARSDSDGTIRWDLEYATDLFDRDTAETMLRDLRALAEAMVADVDTRVSLVPLAMRHRAADVAPIQETAPVADKTVMDSVRAVWRDVLGRDDIGNDDSFFFVGGTSLSAIKVVTRLRKALGVEVMPSLVFEHPTVAAMAATLESMMDHHREPVVDDGVPAPADTAPAVQATTPVTVLPANHRRLSAGQRRLWFLERTGRIGAAYNAPLVLRWRKPLDQAALRGAVNDLARRHEVLRWRFIESDDGPIAVVSDDPVPFARVSAADENECRFLVEAEMERPFDLERESPIRCLMVTVGSDEHVIVVNLHHIVSDGWSQSIIRRELDVAYRAWCNAEPVSLPAAPQFAEYVDREADVDADVEYWRRALDGVTDMDIPLDRPRPRTPTYAGAGVSVTIPAVAATALAEWGRSRAATPFMVFHAIWAATIAQYCGQSDVLIGIPESGRSAPATADIVGLFVNTVAVRTDLSGDPTGTALLDRVRDTALDAYRHAAAPFDRVVEALGIPSRIDRDPLLQVFFSHDAHNADGGDSVDGTEFAERLAKFDLDLSLGENIDGSVAAGLGYAVELFDEPTARAIVVRFARVAEAFAANPDSPLSALTRLSDDELAELVAEGDPAPAPSVVGAHEYLERTADEQGHRPAVRRNGVDVDYRSLDADASRLAWHLRERGVMPESPVMVCLNRTPRMIMAVFAILKAGGAYVPVDPATPADRVADMMDDVGASVVVADDDAAHLFSGVDVVNLDAEADLIAARPSRRPERVVSPDNAAYILFTSGSTGRPKGVVVEHRNLVALAEFYRMRLRPEWLDVVFTASPLGFDASVFEIFAAVPAGGLLLLADSAVELAGHPDAEMVTLLQTVPSLMKELLDRTALPPRLTTVCLGGEALPGDLVDRVVASGNVERVINIYGPTEDTADSSWADVRPGDPSPSIGRPLPGERGYIVDESGVPVPRGARGELYVAGVGVARGYVNRPDENQRRFLPDPWYPGERMYRTGDIVRVNGAGEWVYLGRADRQIKLRGLRIEPGEIERALHALPMTRSAAVAVRRDDHGVDRLVAYVVTDSWDEAEARAILRSRLPRYMVPSAFTVVASLPLTPNGKLDEAALPTPNWAARSKPVAARTDRERRVAELWSEVLGVDSVGVHDNFFDIGGTSFTLMTLRARLATEVGRELSVSELYEQPTVAALAAHWDGLTEPEPDINRSPRLRQGRAALGRRRSRRGTQGE